MFNKCKKTAPSQITITGTMAVKNYTPDPEHGNMYVCEVPDLTVLQSLNPKDQRGIKKLVVTATINDSSISSKFGDHVIVVDQKFKKLPNKDQLVLITNENEKLCGRDSRYTTNFADGIDADQTLVEESARLNTAEQYGAGRTNRALNKAQHFSKKSQTRMEKFLYRSAKKATKASAPKDKAINNPFKKAASEKPQEPAILKSKPAEG